MQLNDLLKIIFYNVIRKLMNFDDKISAYRRRLIGLQARLGRQNLNFTDKTRNLRMLSRSKKNYERKK